MTSSWRRPSAREGHGAPVEMRFVDMFMTALGSLVFIALLLVFLLPKTAEVFLAGTIVAKDGNAFTLRTDDGKVRKIALGPDTKIRHDLAAPIGDFKPGKTMIAAGKASPDGSIAASIIHTPLEGELADKYAKLLKETEIFVAGTVVRRDGQTLTLRGAQGNETTVTLNAGTKFDQVVTGAIEDIVVGRDAGAIGKLGTDGSFSVSILQIRPKPDPVAALQKELMAERARNAEHVRIIAEQQNRIQEQQQEIIALTRQLQERDQKITELEQKIKMLQAQVANLKTEELEVMQRWLGVWAVMDGCSTSDAFFYVRNEGFLVDRQGNPSGYKKTGYARDFTVGIEEYERTGVFGDRYQDVNMVFTSAKLQVKAFHTVARHQSSYSVYIQLKDPNLFVDKSCDVYPVFSSHGGYVVGERLSLSVLRPFSWVKRFELRRHGGNTAAEPPGEGQRAALLAFSRKQSKQLCDSRRICGTEDALLHALRKEEFSRVAHSKLFELKPESSHEFQYSRNYKDEPQKAKDLDECQMRCRDSASCASYTYFRRSHPNPKVRQFCRLMENAGHEILKSEHADSGVKVVLRK